MKFNNIDLSEEVPDKGLPWRQGYLGGLDEFIIRKEAESKLSRREFISPERLVSDPEGYREKLIDILGMNNIPKDACPEPTLLRVGEDELCEIYRLRVYVTREIPFHAMLLIPHGAKNLPLVVCQHGGGGAPELLCGFNGKNNYGFAAQRLMSLGAVVLAPQLLLWSLEESETARNYKVPHNRRKIDTKFRSFGITITGLEVAGIMKCIDFATELPEIDSGKIGMAGLSYGGYFTLYTMAVDKRIKAGLSVGCFNDRLQYPFEDMVYFGSALCFNDAEVASLCAPRPLYVAVGKSDNVFDYHTAIPEAERAAEYYKAYGVPEKFRFDLWEGGHRFPESDEGFEFLLKGLQNNE